MSREIKFRVWRAPDEYTKVSWMESWNSLLNYSMSDIFQLDNPDDVLEQFTGLKDKNGTDIYEGDILKVPFSKSVGEHYDPVTLGYIDCDWFCDTDLIGKVVLWPSTGPRLTQIHADDPDQFDKDHAVPKVYYVTRDCEVIGNIHNNLELLEEK